MTRDRLVSGAVLALMVAAVATAKAPSVPAILGLLGLGILLGVLSAKPRA